MKIVNKSKIPELIHTYLKNDFYDFVPNARSISATGLLKPVRETILVRRHNDEIEIDSIDRLWSLFGTAVHVVLEKGNLSKNQEERISVEIEGFKISGKFDIIHGGFLKDFKTTSAFTLCYPDRMKEWTKQLSIYRWLYWKSKGIELPSKAFVVVILRDWSEREYGRVENYPDCAVKEIELSLMSLEDTEKFILSVITDLRKHEETPDGDLPMCPPNETWNGKKCKKYCNAYKFCKGKGENK